MRKTNNRTNKLPLNTETIRLLKPEQLAAVNGGGTTTTYNLSQACYSQACISQGCITH
jgi:hypothetical protein